MPSRWPQEPQTNPDEDEVLVPAEPVTRTGDLWEVGPHRLLCGDCTEPGVLDLLMDGAKAGCLLTDPPYGMNLDTDFANTHPHGGGTYDPVIGDDRPFDAAPLMVAFADVAEQFWFGADYYRRTLTADDLDGSWLVWDKRWHETMHLEDVIGSQFELLWSRQHHRRHVLRHLWSGHHGLQGDDTTHRVHPTQKPVALLADILTRWAPEGCAVVDPFVGAGSTLVAAGMTGRVGYGIEIDPAYCDVTLSRLQRHTGHKPSRDGEPHDFTTGD